MTAYVRKTTRARKVSGNPRRRLPTVKEVEMAQRRPYIEFTLPWEEPKWYRPVKRHRWRARHERIAQLEAEHGIAEHPRFSWGGTLSYWSAVIWSWWPLVGCIMIAEHLGIFS